MYIVHVHWNLSPFFFAVAVYAAPAVATAIDSFAVAFATVAVLCWNYLLFYLWFNIMYSKNISSIVVGAAATWTMYLFLSWKFLVLCMI